MYGHLLYDDHQYQDTMLTSLETALSEYGLLLCNARRPIPGLPCLSREEQRETVWDEDTQSYLSITSWGLAKPLYAYYNELSYRLRDFTPLFLLVRPKEGVSPPRAQVPKPGYAVLDTTTGITTVYVGSSNARSDGGSKESDEQPINAVPACHTPLNQREAVCDEPHPTGRHSLPFVPTDADPEFNATWGWMRRPGGVIPGQFPNTPPYWLDLEMRSTFPTQRPTIRCPERHMDMLFCPIADNVPSLDVFHM